MSDPICTLAALHVHPLKSGAGVALAQALLVQTGLEYDREWMVVDAHGEMLTQRELPRLALIQPRFKGSELELRAPGMLALHLRLDVVEAATRARVWDDVVKAFDMGDLAAQWCSDFLAPGGMRKLRLVRFDPDERRLSDPQWTRDIEAANLFSDGYPLLVANQASLDELNRCLAARGQPPVGMERFRPNLVLGGLQPFDEDHIHELAIATDDGPVWLRLVKPCVRCSIPNVDPASGEVGPEPGATLAGFRADARMRGGITFGVNAVVREGFERRLRVGQAVDLRWRFDATSA